MKRSIKAWAAIRDGFVVGFVPMHTSTEDDFTTFRERAIKKLSTLGDIKSGEFVLQGETCIFLCRLTHKNRSKKSAPRPRQTFPLSKSFEECLVTITSKD